MDEALDDRIQRIAREDRDPRIAAIMVVREHTGAGLIDAKKVVACFQDSPEGLKGTIYRAIALLRWKARNPSTGYAPRERW